ncbi:trithorax group protein osa-like [Amphibalanus amphitrite]|uniref:trithorax group protein osa-like n=1 Tax=Amphibalanus amphitrite TaxID=1232801 RepID=UPI001C917F63|nr:trithorax group protein osa-like [Amphibalanus amphitrite]
MPASYLRPTFPPDSVEATLPVLARRRRGTRADVGPVDGWRLTMALRSGQLAESRWALDVLQILSFDDASVSWLGLARMPGLLAALLQHFRQSLAAMFSRRAAGEWFEGGAEGEPEPDLGVCRPADTSDSEKVLHGADYTRVSRLGRAVELADCSETILVSPRRRAWEADSADADGGWDHVLTHVKVESGRIPFQRRLVDGRIKEEPADEPMEDAPKVNGQAPLDERLAGFEEPGFFLSRLRRVAPPADCGEGVKPSADDNVKSSAEGDVKPGGDSDQDAKPNADGVKSDAKPSANDAKGDACDASVKQEAMDVDVKLEPGEPPVKEGESAVKAEPVPAEEGKPVALPNGAVSPPAPVPSGILPRGSLKRPPPDEEDECQQRDESSLFLTSETQESVATRCLAASTILRNLSFVPGNEAELATEPVLVLLGDLLQLHHRHPPRAAAHTNYDRDEDADQREPCPAFGGDDWWADFLPALHEHALVTLTNIGGHVRLGGHDEAVVRPVLDGLLHWVQCRSSYAADPLPVSGAALPAARLALEALCRLCVHADNVDLLLATPPGWRLERVCRLAAGWVAAEGDQVRREMALTLLHALAAVDERVGRVLAAETDLTATLVRFVEAAEQSAMSVANSQGVNALRENPDLMGTSLDLLGRAAGLLVSLAPLAEARPALVRCEARLLALVTSQILDQRVAAQLSRVLYTVALPAGERGV